MIGLIMEFVFELFLLVMAFEPFITYSPPIIAIIIDADCCIFPICFSKHF